MYSSILSLKPLPLFLLLNQLVATVTVADAAAPVSVPEAATSISNPIPSTSEARGRSSGFSIESLLDFIRQQAEHRGSATGASSCVQGSVTCGERRALCCVTSAGASYGDHAHVPRDVIPDKPGVTASGSSVAKSGAVEDEVWLSELG